MRALAIWSSTEDLLLILLSFLTKVFRLNGRPYCYSSVSFSLLLLLLRSSVSNGRPYCFCLVSFSLLFFFFLPFLFRGFLQKASIDFHEIFTHDTLWENAIILFLFWWRHFRFWKFDDFVIFDRLFCPDRSSKMVEDRHLEFSQMIDKR